MLFCPIAVIVHDEFTVKFLIGSSTMLWHLNLSTMSWHSTVKR